MGSPTVFPKLRGPGVDESLARAQDNTDIVVRPVAQALAQTPIMGTAPVWTAFVPDAAFAASAVSPPGYYKDSLMRVQTKGSLTTAAGVAANAAVGSFPMGLRPKEPQRLTVRGDAATYQSVLVSPTGIVTCEAAIAAGGTIDLGFSFLAEQ